MNTGILADNCKFQFLQLLKMGLSAIASGNYNFLLCFFPQDLPAPELQESQDTSSVGQSWSCEL
jgi:hypothetical protein